MGQTRGGVVNTSRMLKTFDNILLKRGVVATVSASKTFKPVVYCIIDKQQQSMPFCTQKTNIYEYIFANNKQRTFGIVHTTKHKGPQITNYEFTNNKLSMMIS